MGRVLPYADPMGRGEGRELSCIGPMGRRRGKGTPIYRPLGEERRRGGYSCMLPYTDPRGRSGRGGHSHFTYLNVFY